jgi:hypothetical protein
MSTRNLIVIGSVWFGMVAVWLFFGQTSVSVSWLGKGTTGKIFGTALIYAVVVAYMLFIIGWVLPIGVGIYRLASKH